MTRIDRLRPADRALVRGHPCSAPASTLGTSPTCSAPACRCRPRQPGTASPRTSQRRPTATCASAACWSATSPTRASRFESAGSCTRAGAGLERELGQHADDEAAGLCVHFLLAGHHEKAWRYARLAAERAVKRSAFADATQLYRRALEAARHFAAPRDELSPSGRRSARRSRGPASSRGATSPSARPAAWSAGPGARGGAAAPPRTGGRAGWARRPRDPLGAPRPACARGSRGPRRTGLPCSHAVTLATVRQRQGRMEQAIELCRAAITEAVAADEDSRWRTPASSSTGRSSTRVAQTRRRTRTAR